MNKVSKERERERGGGGGEILSVVMPLGDPGA
jgi:hypothetical protein